MLDRHAPTTGGRAHRLASDGCTAGNTDAAYRLSACPRHAHLAAASQPPTPWSCACRSVSVPTLAPRLSPGRHPSPNAACRPPCHGDMRCACPHLARQPTAETLHIVRRSTGPAGEFSVTTPLWLVGSLVAGHCPQRVLRRFPTRSAWGSPSALGGLTPPVSGGPQPTDLQTGTEPALWAVRSTGMLGHGCGMQDLTPFPTHSSPSPPTALPP
jgi:hypothetical protein